MTPGQAQQKAAELNRTGAYREDWYYYPAYVGEDCEQYTYDQWAVHRRLKTTQAHIQVSIFKSGKIARPKSDQA